METKLGKIESAEMGAVKDYPFLFGLMLTFSGPSWGVSSNGKYTMNICPDCKWDDKLERKDAAEKVLDNINDLLTQAKARTVSELVGKPVEVTFDKYGTFRDFRILTEVL